MTGPRIKWILGCTLSIWSSSHMRLHLLISVVAHTSEALYTYSCVILPLCHKYSHCHEYCNKQLVNCLCHSRLACLPVHYFLAQSTLLCTHSCQLTLRAVFFWQFRGSAKTRKQRDITHPLVTPIEVFIPYHCQAVKLQSLKDFCL